MKTRVLFFKAQRPGMSAVMTDLFDAPTQVAGHMQGGHYVAPYQSTRKKKREDAAVTPKTGKIEARLLARLEKEWPDSDMETTHAHGLREIAAARKLLERGLIDDLKVETWRDTTSLAGQASKLGIPRAEATLYRKPAGKTEKPAVTSSDTRPSKSVEGRSQAKKPLNARQANVFEALKQNRRNWRDYLYPQSHLESYDGRTVEALISRGVVELTFADHNGVGQTGYRLRDPAS